MRFEDLTEQMRSSFIRTVDRLDDEFEVPTDPAAWEFTDDPGTGYANVGRGGLGPTVRATAQSPNPEVGQVAFVFSPRNFQDVGSVAVPGDWLWIGEDV